LKDANCFHNLSWWGAKQSAANLANGQCGLSDGSTSGTWRLPSKAEWKAMIDKNYSYPVLSNAAGTGKWTEGDAFSGVQMDAYWSSNTSAYSNAWEMYLGNGSMFDFNKDSTFYVWPVRD